LSPLHWLSRPCSIPFYRRKYDAARTLRAFSSKLGEETDLNRQGGELVSVVGETKQPVADENGTKAR
jgi:hypothetical protein